MRQACVDRQCNFRDGLPRGDEFVLWSELHILNIENFTNRYIIKNNKRKFWRRVFFQLLFPKDLGEDTATTPPGGKPWAKEVQPRPTS